MKILIIDDNQELAEGVKEALEKKDYFVDIRLDGQSGLLAAQHSNPDLIILDLNLPGMGGRTICRRLREDEFTMPIIIASVRSEIFSKLDLFELGADDYIIKPFIIDELIARIKAHLKRPKEFRANTIDVDDLSINIDKRQVFRADKEIKLTKTEFALLECLAQSIGDVVSRHDLLDFAWGDDIDSLTNTLEVHISALRKKVDKDHPNKLIHNISGVGYKLELLANSKTKTINNSAN